MVEKVRIGLIGAGWVVQNRHLPALRQLPDVELRSIWSRDQDKARRVAHEFGIPLVVDQWQKIAESPELDAVIIGTPPILHLPATAAALDSGKDVLCQARMARNLAEAQEMLRLAQASDRVTMLYPPKPGLKGDRVMRRLLHEEQYVGTIREVRVTGMTLLESTSSYAWTTDPEETGVNAMTLGLWNEVLNRWVGPATRVSAIAKTHNEVRRTPAGELVEAAVPDSLAITAELQCGATASYHLSSCAACGPGHSIEIYGSQGALVYQLFADRILGATGDEAELQEILIPPAVERAQTTDREFVRAIREGTPVTPDFEEGIRYMEFCEAVALSAATGEAVSVPPSRPMMAAWGRFLEGGEPE